MKIKWRLLGLRDHVYKSLQSDGDSYSECDLCGGVISNKQKHQTFHKELAAAALAAHRANMFTTPLK